MVGNTWTYTITQLNPGTLQCLLGNDTMSVEEIIDLADVVGIMDPDAGEAFVVRRVCTGIGAPRLYLRRQAGQLEYYPLGQDDWAVLYAEPVEEGREWPVGTGSGRARWRSAGSVTVPAGTFDRCWDVESLSAGDEVSFRSTFCDGVGLVRETYMREYEVVLESFELR